MYATPRKKDPRYDHNEQRATIPLLLHHGDGTTSEIDLVLNPDEVEMHWAQLDQLIDRRAKERSAEPAMT